MNSNNNMIELQMELPIEHEKKVFGQFDEHIKILENPCAEICMELGHYFYGLKDYEEAVLWYLNAASETPSIIDIHSSGDAPLACLSKCYSTLAAQAKQDKNAELSAAFLAQAEDYQAQAEHWQAAI